MIYTVLAALVAVGCVWASLRRIRFAVEATAAEPNLVLAAVREQSSTRERVTLDGLRRAFEEEPAAEWERELFAALAGPAGARVALVNEQLGELDYRAQRWARVPRVCASISTSAGFLFASLAMRAGLAAEAVDATAVVVSALDSFAVGVAGAVFCIAAQSRASAVVKARLSAVDKLVTRLEAWAEEE